MKTMFIREGMNMTLDPDTKEIGTVPSAREAIQRLYVAPEPMHVIYQSGQRREEADVETDDVIVTFYTDDFDKRMVVVKSKEWAENIKAYENRQQDAVKCGDCDTCEGGFKKINK